MIDYKNADAKSLKENLKSNIQNLLREGKDKPKNLGVCTHFVSGDEKEPVDKEKQDNMFNDEHWAKKTKENGGTVAKLKEDKLNQIVTEAVRKVLKEHKQYGSSTGYLNVEGRVFVCDSLQDAGINDENEWQRIIDSDEAIKEIADSEFRVTQEWYWDKGSYWNPPCDGTEVDDDQGLYSLIDDVRNEKIKKILFNGYKKYVEEADFEYKEDYEPAVEDRPDWPMLKETRLGYDIDNFSEKWSRGTRYDILVDGYVEYHDVPEESVDRCYDEIVRKYRDCEDIPKIKVVEI